MKRITILLIVWLAAAGAARAADPLQDTLQRGLFEEEANRDLDAAIEAYQSVVARYDTNRHIAATAVFRLAESYRKKGMTNEAAARYQRVLRDFSDQETLVNLSRERLVEAGVTVAEGEGVVGAVPDTEAVQARALFEELSGLSRSELRHVLPTVVPDPLLEELIRRYSEAEVELQVKEQNLSSNHPDIRKQLAVIGTLDDQIRTRIQGILTGLGIRASAVEAGVTVKEGEGMAEVPDADALEIRSLLNELNRLSMDELRGVLPAVVPDRILEERFRPLMEAEDQLRRMRLRYTDEHPQVKSARETIQILQDRVDRRIEDIMKGLEVRATAAEAQATGRAETETIDGVRPATAEEAEEIRRLQAMIRNSPDLINAGVGEGTPLHSSAARGFVRAIELLLSNGATVDLRDRYGKTALYAAVENGHKGVVEQLLAAGADVNARDKADNSPLHWAVMKDFREIGRLLIEKGADVTARTSEGSTPLHKAVDSSAPTFESRVRGVRVVNSPDWIPLLVKEGADINAADSEGRTALHLAAGKEDGLEAVKVLLEHGADPNLRSEGEQTPLHGAIGKAPLEIADLLIHSGARVDARSASGQTALHHASGLGRPEMTELLIRHGADLEVRDNSNRTPLQVAVLRREYSVGTSLLEGGADPDLIFQPEDGPHVSPHVDAGRPPLQVKTPTSLLHLAVLLNARNPEGSNLVKSLILHSANLDARDAEDQTPLHLAASHGLQDVVRLLLEQGANVNAQDNAGNTPLHYSTTAYAVAELLLARKPKVNVLNLRQETPLSLASESRKAGDLASSNFPLSVPQRVRGSAPGSFQIRGARGVSASTANRVAGLLLEHGAIEDFQRIQSISWWRPGMDQRQVVFPRGTNDWNRFELLDGIVRAGAKFPELSRIAVSRFDQGTGGTERFAFDVQEMIASGNCGTNFWLQWGDIIEIPEVDHPVNAHWAGPTDEVQAFLDECLKREVTLVVGDVASAFTSVVYSPHQPVPVPRAASRVIGDRQVRTLDRRRIGLFEMRLRELVIQRSQMLRTSSDLSRVNVTRTDPETGEKKEAVFDLTEEVPWYNDLWLRDGDVIEVPDKP